MNIELLEEPQEEPHRGTLVLILKDVFLIKKNVFLSMEANFIV